jgi:hypothetical protein
MEVQNVAAREVREVPRGYWEDANGNFVPVSKIKDVDKTRNQLVLDLCANATTLNRKLAEFKGQTMAQIEAFLQSSALDYGVTLRGAAGKGNVTLMSYDGRYKVVRAMAEKISFDERLQVAKSIIDECIHRWQKGANKNLQVLVNQAFQTDKEGNVSAGRILALRRYEIDDEQWDKAMDAIADSMRVASSKAYVRCYQRNDLTGEYEPITLDMAGV